MRITAVEVFGVECGLPAPLRWGKMEVATKGVCPNFRREVSHFSVPADVVQMENEQIPS